MASSSKRKKLLYPVALLITASHVESSEEINDSNHLRRAADISKWTEKPQHRKLRDRTGDWITGSNFEEEVSDGENDVFEGFNDLFLDDRVNSKRNDGESIYDATVESQPAAGPVLSGGLFKSASKSFQTKQQSTEPCVLQNGLYGDIAAGKLIYDIIYKYQTTLVSGADPEEVLPYIENGVPEGILPALFPECGDRRILQMNSETFFGISSSADDIIAPYGLNCLKENPTDCYVFEGYLTVSTSLSASEDEVIDYIRSEVKELMQGTYLESRNGLIVDVQYLNPDFTTVAPVPTISPGGAPAAESPTGSTPTGDMPTGGTPIGEPTSQGSTPTPDLPSPVPNTNPASSEVVTTSSSDEGLLQWWMWVLIGAGAAACMLPILLFQGSTNQKPRPLSSSDLVSTKDVEEEYVPPGMENNQFNTSGPKPLVSTPGAVKLPTVAESKTKTEEEDEKEDEEAVEYEEEHEEDGFEGEHGGGAEEEYASSVDPEDEEAEEYDEEHEHDFEEESYYEEETIHNDSDNDQTSATPKR